MELLTKARAELHRQLQDANPKSFQEHERRSAVLPSGINSGARWRLFPLTFEQTRGAKLHDLDGNEYVDCLLGFGPAFLGHNHPKVQEAAIAAMQKLDMPGGGTELEFAVIDLMRAAIPCAEQVVFSVSGTEAVQAAFRIARATTRRNVIVRFEGHYHGWIGAPNAASTIVSGQSTAQAQAPSASGEDVVILPWNDVEALETFMQSHGAGVAAVIMEAVALNSGTFESSENYLAEVREITRRHGALLIFDEVISGFRIGLGGAQEKYGVTPDLATFAKAMANGYPIAAVAGTDAAMSSLTRGEIVHAGTYTSWPAALAAAQATITLLRDNHETLYPHVEGLGQTLAQGIRELATSASIPLQVNHIGSLLQLTWGVSEPVRSYTAMTQSSLEHVRLLGEGAAMHGAYIAPRGLMFLSTEHSDQDIQTVLNALTQSVEWMKTHRVA